RNSPENPLLYQGKPSGKQLIAEPPPPKSTLSRGGLRPNQMLTPRTTHSRASARLMPRGLFHLARAEPLSGSSSLGISRGDYLKLKLNLEKIMKK
mgnify:CR=1